MDVALSDHLRKRRDEDDDDMMLFLPMLHILGSSSNTVWEKVKAYIKIKWPRTCSGVASRSCEELSGSVQDGA
jgi:hypothetical protein